MRDTPPPPPPCTHVALQRFFDGLAAGAELEQLVQLLRHALSQQQQQQRCRCEHRSNTTATSSSSSALLSSSWSPQFCKAAKAAMLFCVESNAAAEQATRLYYGNGNDADGDSRGSSGSEHVMATVVSSAHLPALLSDRVTAEVARRAMHRSSGSNWQHALRLLLQVDRTPTTAAAVLDVCSRVGLWSLALEQLSFLPARRWSELDVGNAIRALYRAASTRQTTTSSSSDDDDDDSDAWCTLPRRVLLRAAQHGVALSTPSALNDALGVLATQPRRRVAVTEARYLLDMLLTQTATATTVATATSDAASGDDASVVADDSDSDADNVDNDDATATRRTTLLFAAVRANAVTVCQASRALRGDWQQALQYTAALVQQHAVAFAHDLYTCESLLHNCVTGGCASAALSIVQQRHEWLTQQQTRQPHGRVASSSSNSSSGASRTSYAPTLFVPLLRLLCAHAGVATATRLLLTPPPSSSSSSSPRDVWQALRRLYSLPTVCAVLNVLLQHTTSVSCAEAYRAQIVTVATMHRQRRLPHVQTKPQQQQQQQTDDGVECASHAPLAMLYAMDGQWQRALASVQPLLRATAPRHPHTLLTPPLSQQQPQQTSTRTAHTYTPSAQLHDALQYALECGNAPWQVAVQLYMDMSAHQTPLSAIAFQSATRTCMQHGAYAQASALLHHMMRTGVRR